MVRLLTRSSGLKEKQKPSVPSPVGLTFIRKNSAVGVGLSNFKRGKPSLRKSSKEQIHNYSYQLKQLENEIRLAQKREKLAPSKTSKSTTPNLPASVKGKVLLVMEFDNFQLEGEIGKFLGEMDRHLMAIVLMGDDGGGKSYFSVALAQAFEKADFSVAYFSLEMGIGKSLKRAIEVYAADEVDFIKKGA